MLTRNHVYILIQTFLHHHHKLYIYKNTTIYLINYNKKNIIANPGNLAISIRNVAIWQSGNAGNVYRGFTLKYTCVPRHIHITANHTTGPSFGHITN